MLQSCMNPNLVEAGLDEAGRGCLAGPVVAAAVIFPSDYSHPLLNDSKQLSKKHRDQLREDIMKDALAWAVAEVDREEIDNINILNAALLAMRKAVDQLSVKPQMLLVDGNRFHAYPGIPHQCIIKGDGLYLSIAAASILAKTHRDELMCKLALDHPQYGWETNAGYGTERHREAIMAHGITIHHRRSFNLSFQTDLFN